MATTADEWKTALRARLRVALGAKDKATASVLRDALAALDNAEAPPMSDGPASVTGVIAGSAGGLGAGERARLELSPEDALGVLERELHERRDAAEAYVRLGRHDEATVLSSQASVLEDLLASER